VSIFQNVDWVVSLAMAVCLVVIFAIVNVRLRLSLLRQRGETTVAGCAAFNNVAEERRLGQLKPGNKKDEQNRCAGGPWREYGSLA
jgi:hypothetical protein